MGKWLSNYIVFARKTLFEIPTAANNGATNSKFLFFRTVFLTLSDAILFLSRASLMSKLGQ